MIAHSTKELYKRHCPSSLTRRFSLTHAILLDRAFAHCPIFPTAASLRSLGRVSVPVLLIVRKDQLSICGLVSLYPTNYLILRRLIKQRFLAFSANSAFSLSLSLGFGPNCLADSHALRTRSPLCLQLFYRPKTTFDLHVLSISLAFILSQDQTRFFGQSLLLMISWLVTGSRQ